MRVVERGSDRRPDGDADSAPTKRAWPVRTVQAICLCSIVAERVQDGSHVLGVQIIHD